MQAILEAILDDQQIVVTHLLKLDRGLATQSIERPILYSSRIFHWLYAGDTALHLAAAGYRNQIVRTLLEAGADPNSAGNHRRSRPLHYAADGYVVGPAWDAQQQVKTIRILLDAGADLHAMDKNGATALHRAVRTRCAAAVGSLLKAGADPNQRNVSGSTAFHLAVQNTGRGGAGAEIAIAAQRQIIEKFLEIGVSPSIKDGKGKTVSDWARSIWIQNLLSENAPNPKRKH